MWVWETGRIRFRRAQFQTPNSVSFPVLTEFRGESSVSSSQSNFCLPKRTHWELSESSLPRAWCVTSPYISIREGKGGAIREGANREKLTVKKLIDSEMFFFHRLCPLQTVKNRRKPWKNRRQTVKKSAAKIHHFFTVSFSPFTPEGLARAKNRHLCGLVGCRGRGEHFQTPLRSKRIPGPLS